MIDHAEDNPRADEPPHFYEYEIKKGADLLKCIDFCWDTYFTPKLDNVEKFLDTKQTDLFFDQFAQHRNVMT